MSVSLRVVLCLFFLGSSLAFSRADGRTLPKPLADHPGHIFVAGEDVTVTLPAATQNAWRAVDYDGKTVAQGQGGGPIHLGRLPVGYYEVRRDGAAAGAAAHISLGVLAPLAVPTPKTSPIGIDVAMAWSFPENRDAGRHQSLHAGGHQLGPRPAELGRDGATARQVCIPYALRHVRRHAAPGRTANLAGQSHLPGVGGPGFQAVSHRSPSCLPFLSGHGRAVGGQGSGLRALERGRHRRLRRPHRQRNRHAPEGVLLGLEGGQPPEHRLPKRVRRPCPGHSGRLPCQPGVALFRYLQSPSLRGRAPISEYLRRLPHRLGGPAAVGHRVQRGGALVGRCPTAGARRR